MIPVAEPRKSNFDKISNLKYVKTWEPLYFKKMCLKLESRLKAQHVWSDCSSLNWSRQEKKTGKIYLVDVEIKGELQWIRILESGAHSTIEVRHKNILHLLRTGNSGDGIPIFKVSLRANAF